MLRRLGIRSLFTEAHMRAITAIVTLVIGTGAVQATTATVGQASSALQAPAQQVTVLTVEGMT